jgi:hypothetical protein
MNATDDAPGANDDASGTSATLELARVIAPHPTDATIVFVAYAGAEQGLYGSNHLAQVATELRWDANPESDVVGYEVVWRDSTEPLWTHARRVGNVTGYTIAGLNKDDVQVGVRAIDGEGNRSPVATTVPASQ